MKRTWIAVVAASLLTAGLAWAQPYGYGMGHGMGYGMGPGMIGRGAWSEGVGPGAMGPGTMGGGRGWGMGHGMMMGGFGDDAYAGLEFSAEQRKQIAEIRQQAAQAHWQLMGTMHGRGRRMHDVFTPGALDEKGAREAFQAMLDSHKAMFELQLDVRKKIDALLTPAQREQLERYWGGRR